MSKVFPLYLGKSEDDQVIKAHLETMVAEGGNASAFVKTAILQAINGRELKDNSVMTQGEKLDEILAILRSGVRFQAIAGGIGEATLPTTSTEDDGDTGRLKEWLLSAEDSF